MFVRRLYEDQRDQIEQDMDPFGFISDGLDDDSVTDQDGTIWRKTDLMMLIQQWRHEFYVGVLLMDLGDKFDLEHLSVC